MHWLSAGIFFTWKNKTKNKQEKSKGKNHITEHLQKDMPYNTKSLNVMCTN
jgi:hypothetical protein